MANAQRNYSLATFNNGSYSSWVVHNKRFKPKTNKNLANNRKSLICLHNLHNKIYLATSCQFQQNWYGSSMWKCMDGLTQSKCQVILEMPNVIPRHLRGPTWASPCMKKSIWLHIIPHFVNCVKKKRCTQKLPPSSCALFKSVKYLNVIEYLDSTTHPCVLGCTYTYLIFWSSTPHYQCIFIFYLT